MPKCSPGESARGGRGEGGRKGWGSGSAGTFRSPDRGGSVVLTAGVLTHIFQRFLGVALKC